jgi:hypothetical protein
VRGRVVVANHVAQVRDALENLFELEDAEDSSQIRVLKDDGLALETLRGAVMM